ncbi:MAG TPA: kinase [Rhodanobacteraceae bacterium]|nr:kinase [Rhodanobacteraceae bacterium]
MPHDAITQDRYPDAIVHAVLDALTRAELRPWLIGLSGLQGSGKSTLAAQLVELAARRGIAALALSIDDFYFGRAARQRLARDVHPLLATRGVPGTHDIELLHGTLDALRAATPRRPARVPRFDKGLDTRVAPSRWHRVARMPELVILEGWCIGVPPQDSAALVRPVNQLEHDEDRDALWRNWVNAQLARHYVPLWQRLDRLIMLQAPDYAVVARWRDEQERALRRRNAPRALTPTALKRFLMHYERLSRHALKALPARADLRIVLDEDRRVRRLVKSRQPFG